MVEKLFPALVAVGTEMDSDNRIAFRLFRLLDEFHASLFGGAAAFPDVAGRAGADDVGPSAFAAERSRHDMIEG